MSKICTLKLNEEGAGPSSLAQSHYSQDLMKKQIDIKYEKYNNMDNN